MNKTLRRVMLRFLKQHDSVWESCEGKDFAICDICYCLESENTPESTKLASYIRKEKGNEGPYSHIPPKLCNEHAQELGLVW